MIQKLTISIDSFLDIWTTLSSILSAKELEVVAYITKGLCQRRNEEIYQDKFYHPNYIIRMATSAYVVDYTQTLNSGINTPKGPPTHSLSLWQKPPPSFMKLNWDATCNIEI